MTPEKSFEFWRRFSAGLGFSYSVGFAKPLSGAAEEEEEEGEDGDSWHKVSDR